MRALRLFLSQRGAGGKIAAHAVDTPAGRGRGGAEVKALGRSRVQLEGGPREDLPEVLNTAVDITADEVRVAPLEFGRWHDATREYALPEAGCESLDLIFDPLRHVKGRSVGHMAV